jgi:hypothetical protein
MNITAQQAFRMIAWWTHYYNDSHTEGINNEDKLLLRSLIECLEDCDDVWYVNTAIPEDSITYHHTYQDFRRYQYPYLWSDEELTPEYIKNYNPFESN